MIREVTHLSVHRGKGVILRFLFKRGLEKYYEKIKKKRAKIMKPLEKTSYGLRRFYVRDSDGFILKFATSY